MSLTTIPVASVADYNSSSAGVATVPAPDADSTSTPIVSAGSTAPPNPLAKDLSALLTDLASGNIQKSSEDLLKLKQDLKAQQSLQGPTASASQAPGTGSLEKVVSSISSALNSGSTEDALAGLSSYLVQSGQSSGTAVKTSA
ncbi:hypothetical protein [Granulicella tundricola]|uniref:Proteophosphoglycan 5 n=1 Tax=Granulicella tundricola (strain ATCC BAA-1859 / DSM 23138 / MP5ACTX9) TaxID=1198114 RepID=E8X5I4_GRATM|nr:hypothetical protein [Granulicella tundricola]ADW70611.1 proteophosphoglycan 5 [Granulicella tundricola MP5ACTX9]